jgi:pseudouridine synthase
LTQTLLHPKHSTPKEYVAVVTGRVDEALLKEQFTAGVITGTGNHTADLVSVHHWDDATTSTSSDNESETTPHHSVSQFLQEIKTGMPKEYNQTDLKVRGYLDVFDATELSTVTLTVTEGKHRMVRRMLANCGHAVVALKRERLGIIALGDLAVGDTRPLTAEEQKWAEKQLGSSQKKTSKPYRKKEKSASESS